ncbi:MAG: hypothetical protein HY735_35135, partial [Verrucomicrobia bacterium]|nr:hypothetical protein [Verrucomicrobiota bacterium]
AHVVFTRETGGQARLYIDGKEVVNQTVAGNLSNWFEYRLSLGGELNEVTQAPADHRFRSWLGEFYRLAIYRRALTAQQVGDNYRQFAIGSDTAAPTAPQNLTVRAGAVFAELSWGASTDNSGRVFYEVQRNGQSIASFLTTTSYVDQTVSPSTAYNYQVRAIDLSRNASAFTATVPGNTKALAPVTGVIKAEFYTDITGTSVDDLRASATFPATPNLTRFFPAAELPVDALNNYGARVTGWFVPPQTGAYVFFLSSDDQGELRLSTDATAGNLKLIAMEPQYNAFRAWTATTRRDPASPENRSDTFLGTAWTTPDPATGGALINLQAGNRYYFEALAKEGTGGDNLAVTYKLKPEPDPAAGAPSRLRGNVIQTVADPDFVLPVVKTPPQSQGVAFGQSVTLSVELAEFSSPPFTYQWRFGGNPIAGATGATYTIPSFQLQNVGYYSVAAANLAGAATSGTAYLRPQGSGLLALYTFQEGTGATVRDVSNTGSPLNLEINDPSSVRWLPNQGLAVNAPNVIIASAGPATKVIDGVVASSELSVEVWATPADLTLTGPARFVTVSATTGLRNFTLGQEMDAFQFRFRTSATDANAGPVAFYTTSPPVAQTQLTHIVYTRNVDGLARMYVNGVEVAQNTTVTGTTATWDPSYRLALANELTGDRGWVGEFRRVAIYSFALPSTEVAANFQAGPNPAPPTTVQPVTLANAARTANTVRFDFPTATGRRYVVEFKNELTASAWTELQTITGNGAMQSAVDANATTAARFYRVRTE